MRTGLALMALAAIVAPAWPAAGGLPSLRSSGATCAFDPARGGRLGDVRLDGGPALTGSGRNLVGEWVLDLGLGDSPDETWAPSAGAGAIVERRLDRLTFSADGKGLRLVQVFRAAAGAPGLVAEAWLVNLRQTRVVLGRASFTLGPIQIGGRVAEDEYLYPPGVFQQIRGPVTDALPGPMGARYIYGCLQATDKLMLPLAAVWDGGAGAAVSLACRNDEAVARVGVIGGEEGHLQAAFGIYRAVQPGGRLFLGKVLVALWRSARRPAGGTSWVSALETAKRACLANGIVAPPAAQPPFAKDLQIAWVGPDGPPYGSFDAIRERLGAMAAGGLNAVIVGGRTWFCRNSVHPDVLDFLPVLRGGQYTPDDTASGGVAGLRRLIAEGHRLGMRVFCWGPTLAGVALESPEVAGKPDWWIRKADGSLNLWYPTLAPPDASVEGWRRFVVGTVRRIITDYGFDGCWLDSTWKDHGLNWQSAGGWYGGPNGAKVSLLREIRRAAKSLKPDFLLMAESGGAETASAFDLWYVRALGVFALVPPERMQEAVMTEEACRLPGARPFGQFQVDPGPLGDEHPTRRPLLLPDSYKATLFLINTLPRVPAYFVGDPLAGLLDQPELGAVTRRLMAVRRERRELVDGEVVFGGVDSSAPQVVRFCRVLGRRASLVLVNCGAGPVTSRITLTGRTAALFAGSGRLRDLLGQATVGPTVRRASGAFYFGVTLPGYRGAVLTR
jgi:hypothetical protein